MSDLLTILAALLPELLLPHAPLALFPQLDLLALWTVAWPAVVIAGLRCVDVTLNVFRTVFVVQERRLLAAVTAGLESGTWLAAAGIVFANMTPLRTAAFVVGVAAGTAIGVELTRRMQLGMVTVRIYANAAGCDPDGRHPDDVRTRASGDEIARVIHDAGYGATTFRGQGYRGPVDLVVATVRRRDAQQVVRLARSVEPEAFAAVDNTLDEAPGARTLTAGRV